jgi:hypothetical protein
MSVTRNNHATYDQVLNGADEQGAEYGIMAQALDWMYVHVGII